MNIGSNNTFSNVDFDHRGKQCMFTSPKYSSVFLESDETVIWDRQSDEERVKEGERREQVKYV